MTEGIEAVWFYQKCGSIDHRTSYLALNIEGNFDLLSSRLSFLCVKGVEKSKLAEVYLMVMGCRDEKDRFYQRLYKILER